MNVKDMWFGDNEPKRTQPTDIVTIDGELWDDEYHYEGPAWLADVLEKEVRRIRVWRRLEGLLEEMPPEDVRVARNIWHDVISTYLQDEDIPF
jgi:hypothetical protein